MVIEPIVKGCARILARLRLGGEKGEDLVNPLAYRTWIGLVAVVGMTTDILDEFFNLPRIAIHGWPPLHVPVEYFLGGFEY